MTKLNVYLATNVNMTLEGSDFNTESVQKTLNDHNIQLLNFGGNIVSKGIIHVIAPEQTNEATVKLTLGTGQEIMLDRTSYNAEQITIDAKDPSKTFIKVADAIVNKMLISSIFVVQ